MKRRLATALASAALLALSVTAGTGADAQANQGPERTGEKTTRDVQQSCPVHPEVKARSAARCPKCRAEERKMKGARDKSKINRPQQQEGAAVNE